MATTPTEPIPILHGLPVTLSREGALGIELEQGVLIFRVSKAAQERIEELLDKHREASLSPDEKQELEQYEEVDDYLSFINRLSRNIAQVQHAGLISAT